MFMHSRRGMMRTAAILDLLADGLGDLGHVLRKRSDDLQVVLAHAQTTADSLKLVGTGTILTTRHGGREVVGEDHDDVGVLVDSRRASPSCRYG